MIKLYLILLILFIISSIDNLVPKKYVNLKNPLECVNDSSKIGYHEFKKNCISCHGNEGWGDGIKSVSFEEDIPDLEGSFEKSDGELYYRTFIGKYKMPQMGKRITDPNHRWLVIKYIKEDLSKK